MDISVDLINIFFEKKKICINIKNNNVSVLLA